VIVRQVGDELIVYDPKTHMAHCLNQTAALVYQAVDESTDVAALSVEVRRLHQVELQHDVILAILEQLDKAGLIKGARPTSLEVQSRRTTMRAVGLAALAPIVASLVVPTPAEAANTCIPQASCTAANFGQPCYVVSQAECPSKICTGTPGQCQ
jgi:hypothetical protein